MPVSQSKTTSHLLLVSCKALLSQLLHLGELCFAAGIASKPIGIILRDFPSDIEMEIWRRLTEKYPPASIAVIRTAAEASKFLNALNKYRAALLPVGMKGDVGISTTLELHRNKATALPILLTSYTSKSQDTPAVTLLFTYRKDYENELFEELMESSASVSNDADEPVSQEYVQVDTSNMLGLIKTHMRQDNKWTLADVNLLDALLAGAAIRDQQSSENQPDKPIVAKPEHYDKVRSLLQSPLLEDIRQSYDQLTSLMLDRAYLYTSPSLQSTERTSKAGRSPSKKRKKESDKLRSIVDPRIITKVELIDLGRSSQLFQDLVKRVLNPADKDALKLLGLQESHVVQILAKPSLNKQVCQAFHHLSTWSEKQVRNRFDQLVRDGLIRRGRSSGNRSIPYLLPATLPFGSSPYATLPRYAELRTKDSVLR